MPAFRVVVLASGTGTLFQALTDASADGAFDVVGLICDKTSPVIQRAVSAGVRHVVVEVGADRDEWDKALVNAITAFTPDLIVSAGFMRILGPEVLRHFEGRIINTHPALLPAFPGAHAVRDALEAGAVATGCTIHFVDAGMDTGQVIVQQSVAILPTDTQESLHERIKSVERALLIKTVSQCAAGEIPMHIKEVQAT